MDREVRERNHRRAELVLLLGGDGRKEKIMDRLPKAVLYVLFAVVGLLVLATGIASILLFVRAF